MIMIKPIMRSSHRLFKKTLIISCFLIGTFIYSQEQAFQISGTVSSLVDGSLLPGANVIEKGTDNGTQSDFDGNYHITVSDPNAILVFSFVGFATKEVPINGQSTIQVSLEEDAAALAEVVVLGYGKSAKKEDLTGAVSVVGIKDIEKTPLVSVDQALQGRASGINLTQTSGAPGAPLKIRVRGSNSITGNNDPLVVVDGLIDVDINSVNPADIKSFAILKDASSTAIYGNRGANGVIIITTKKGVNGKSIVEAGTFVSVSNPINTIDLLGAEEFIEYANIKNVAATGSLITQFNTPEKINALVANSVDYQDELYRAAFAQNYQMSIRGGNDKMNYYVSGNYLDQEGLAIHTNFKRYGVRSNINADVSDKFKITSAINLIRKEGFNNGQRFNNSLARLALGFDPTTPVFNENGTYNTQTIVTGGLQTSVLTNPIFSARETRLDVVQNTVQANLSFNYKLLKNLDLNLNTGIEYDTEKGKSFSPENTGRSPIRISQDNYNRLKTQMTLRLTYENTFNEKHNLLSSAIVEERKDSYDEFSANGTGQFTTSVGADNLGLSDLQTISSDLTKRVLRSVIGRTTYNYDSKYLLTASFRYDQSNVFANNQTEIFPSFALGWNINNESFFNLESVSLLRFRLGWGLTGNENIDTNSSLNRLRNNLWLPNGGQLGSTGILPSSRRGNPNLKWETTSQSNVGLDVGFMNDRFSLSLEYYKKITSDLLLAQNLAEFTGYSSQITNAGEVENSGLDASVTGRIIQNENFSWDATANISLNKNEVTSLVGDQTQIFIGDPSVVQVGEPLGSFYGFVFEGVDPANGNAIYADERAIIGDANPDYTFGINNTLSYKNFDFNFFVQGVQGNDVYYQVYSELIGRTGNNPFGTSVDLRNTWTATNTDAPLPSLNATNTQLMSSEFIRDGSFIKLKNVSLGYTVKDVDGLGFSSVRLYASAQNLWVITDYPGVDPEVSSGDANDDRFAGIDNGSMPTARTFTFGLNFKF